MVLRVVVLPAPLVPMRRDDLALVHGQRDALERVDVAVVGVEVLDLEQAMSGLALPRPAVGALGRALAQVRLDDPRVALDLRRRALRRCAAP